MTLRMRKLGFLVLIAAGVIGSTFLLLWISGRAVGWRTGPEHVFQLEEPPRFLTDELALGKARETLVLDGCDISSWEPKEDRRTVDPDNKPDRYLARNAINPNRGVVSFLNREKTQARAVSVELRGNEVVCQSTIGK